MKLTIEKLVGEHVQVSAGQAAVWAGTTPDGFRCLILLRVISVPEGSPEEEWSEFETIDSTLEELGLPQGELERLAKIAFPDGHYVAQKPLRGFTE